MAAFFDATRDHLPPLEELTIQPIGPKEKATVALQVLRKAAVANRRCTGRPFYSIRTVARHFALPTTTVTRLYEQLKTEGVLGSIWGSKTVIEPIELDNAIRLKAIVALPVPLRAFSAVSTFRLFVLAMQKALSKQRFGSRVLFYDESAIDAFAFADQLLDASVEIVIWLMPPRGMYSCLARLRDRGVKLLEIADESPINGTPGYYLNWQDALVRGLKTWKAGGTNTVLIIDDRHSSSARTLRLLQSNLVDSGFEFRICEIEELGNASLLRDLVTVGSGVIFLTAESLIHFRQIGVEAIDYVVRNCQILFLHGGVDLPYETDLNRRFSTIRFDWTAISGDIVRRLVARHCVECSGVQSVFKGRWEAGH